MLLQFAQMGAAYSSKRYGVARPRVALLSIGEEKSKGTPLVKEAHALLAGGGHGDFDFVGNVEGRDFFEDQADVIVTDGFTGNVALKTLEGTLRFLIATLTGILAAARGGRRRRRAAARTCCRWPPSSTPRTPAAPCCSAWTGCASSATARRRRWPWSTPSPWPTTWPSDGLVDAVAASVRFDRATQD